MVAGNYHLVAMPSEVGPPQPLCCTEAPGMLREGPRAGSEQGLVAHSPPPKPNRRSGPLDPRLEEAQQRKLESMLSDSNSFQTES